MKYISTFFLLCIPALAVFAQKSLLQSGPMLGYTHMAEAMLWVQTKSAAEVQFVYWEKEMPSEKRHTGVYQTNKKEGFTAHLVADQVEPGKHYEYQLLINKQPIKFDYPTTFQTLPLWQWRTDPPPFKMAIGSCFYVNETKYDRPGKPYGGDYRIFKAIHEQRPDAMLWLGDNTYLREVDFYSRTGYVHRYTHTRSLPELQPLLASTHHYAIWDDHDYGPNDSDRSSVYKDMSKEVFQQFWANPTYGLPGKEGITTFFQWADMDFFLLDNRTFRKPNDRITGKQVLLGSDQMEWLVDALVASHAPFKFVAMGGQFLNPNAKFERYSKLCPEERSYLLRRIEEEGIKNVVFLTGDVHHSEMSKLVLGNGSTVYDLTVSPFTSGVYKADGGNPLLEEGTVVNERNFGILEFSGPREERVMTIRIFNSDGEEKWTKEIVAED
ncbi:MAG TPA: alkaline phosphatase family protein [Bacteroidetes bacterium]|nr:alkaline phosphatase family protein [Bacteroidota bacterium]